ncbi:MAG: dimethylsulfonioproprionate lyase DddP [Pseudomonadota bacterium]
MNTHYRDHRKIDPSQGTLLGDGSPNVADRAEIGPTPLAFEEWAKAGLILPNLDAMRHYRWKRLVDAINARGYGGLLVFDPLNIRYATDSTNMQLWNAHNPFRCVFVGADGYMIIWDYKNAAMLTEHNPLVREVRSGADFFYFDRGDMAHVAAKVFAEQVVDLVAEYGGGTMRLAVDKPMMHCWRALEAAGFELFEGEELTEKARSIKGADEILAMRCAVHSCEVACAAMEEACVPGRTEDDIWAVLHAENIKRGGEWIETRLLTSGPRTNPWFMECGPRTVQNNEIVAFDTDLVGPYGICCDISRTWWVGDEAPRQDMIDAMRHGVEHIQTNADLLAPGVSFRDLTFKGHQLDEKYNAQKYSCRFHGVGLCDEWPLIAYADNFVEGAFDYVLEPGMTLCVEVLVSEVGKDFSIKLEDQVLITEDGYEMLSSYPYDARLMGNV